jgi:hypothetical protein
MGGSGSWPKFGFYDLDVHLVLTSNTVGSRMNVSLIFCSKKLEYMFKKMSFICWQLTAVMSARTSAKETKIKDEVRSRGRLFVRTHHFEACNADVQLAVTLNPPKQPANFKNRNH